MAERSNADLMQLPISPNIAFTAMSLGRDDLLRFWHRPQNNVITYLFSYFFP